MRDALQEFLDGKEILVMYDETLTKDKPTFTVEKLDAMLSLVRFLVDEQEETEAASEILIPETPASETIDEEIADPKENAINVSDSKAPVPDKGESATPVEERLIVHKRDFNKVKALASEESKEKIIDTTQNKTKYAKTSVLDEHAEEVKQLLKDGMSRKEAAEKYNVRHQTMDYWLKKRGLYGTIPSEKQAPPTSGQRKCSTCIFRQTDKNLGNCAYIEVMGHTRGCSATECDKYVKGKPLKKGKKSALSLKNEMEGIEDAQTPVD